MHIDVEEAMVRLEGQWRNGRRGGGEVAKLLVA